MKRLNYQHDAKLRYDDLIRVRKKIGTIMEGLTIITEALDYGHIQSHLSYIVIPQDKAVYDELIRNHQYDNVLVLSPAKQLDIKEVLKYVRTSHLTFVKDIKDLICSDEPVHFRSNHIYIAQRVRNSELNHVLKGEETKEDEEIAPAQIDTEKQTSKVVHPNVVKIHVDIESLNDYELQDGAVGYPMNHLLTKLYEFYGIIIPKQFLETHRLKASITDNRFEAITEMICHHAFVITPLADIQYVAEVRNLLHTKDLETMPSLNYLNEVALYRNTTSVNSFIQHVADILLLRIGNKIDKGETKLEIELDKLKAFKTINLEILNKGRAEELVIAYCFPPYNDTSGNVMAKRIYMEGNKVDIISNNMDRIRKKDYSLEGIAKGLIDTKFIVDAKQAFSSYESIETFTQLGMEIFSTFKDKYNKLYSRAMFPASHFLAYEIKLSKPEIYWRAEFSDPLLTDVKSEKRFSPIKSNEYIEHLRETLPEAYQSLADDNVFNVCEILPLAYADELIFTNKLQLEYIIRRFDSDIQESIRKRSVISAHPTLPQSFYHMAQAHYEYDEAQLNFAYFGNFYDTRGFREIELMCKYLILDGITNFKVNVFTNINAKTNGFYNNSDFKDYIRLNPYLDYFEFLNLTEQMDILMIYDAHTKGIKDVNPYLPSKLSDYLGSSAYTLAFIEEGSILSEQVDEKLYKVDMNHFSAYGATVREINKHLNKALTLKEEVSYGNSESKGQ